MPIDRHNPTFDNVLKPAFLGILLVIFFSKLRLQLKKKRTKYQSLHYRIAFQTSQIFVLKKQTALWLFVTSTNKSPHHIQLITNCSFSKAKFDQVDNKLERTDLSQCTTG